MEPTVSDANIVLGKLNGSKILGGRMEVDIGFAKKALQIKICDKSSLSIEDAAAGVVSVVNSNMVRAIRMVSVERGYDVREFTLMAFGGAGPLHACEVAAELGISRVLIPPAPGTLCSLGLLMADTKFDLSRSNVLIAESENLATVRDMFKALVAEGAAMLAKQKVAVDNRRYVCLIDCRYERQNYEIPIEVDCDFDEAAMGEMIERFHIEHDRSYGYSDKNMRVQMVNYRLSATGLIMKPELKDRPIRTGVKAPEPIEQRGVRFEGNSAYLDTAVYRRCDMEPGCTIEGPAIVEQMDSTSVIPMGWKAFTDGFGNMFVTREGKIR